MQQAMITELYLRKSELLNPIEKYIFWRWVFLSCLPLFYETIKSIKNYFELKNNIGGYPEANPNDLSLKNLKDLKKSGGTELV